MSLSLIAEVAPSGSVIDVGGGASPLAGQLLDAGYSPAVLDIAPVAIDHARERLGARRSGAVRWIVGDVTAIESVGQYDVWHDRATFHFLTEPQDRERYVNLLESTVPVGGHAIIATFAPDGPATCSGLNVMRYDGKSLHRQLGDGFDLLKSVPEIHRTPWRKPQSFQYSLFRRIR